MTHLHAKHTKQIRDVRGGAFFSGAGRGQDENPRGGAVGAAKKLNIKIFKWQAEIAVTLPLLNSKIFGLSHWLLN